MVKNIFNKEVSNEIINRINCIKPDTQPKWGTMSPAQMFSHCSVTYEMVCENIHKKPNAFFRLILKLFVKKSVTGEKPYKHNLKTAPQFIIKETKDFEKEKQRLMNYIIRTQEHGADYFDSKESNSFYGNGPYRMIIPPRRIP